MKSFFPVNGRIALREGEGEFFKFFFLFLPVPSPPLFPEAMPSPKKSIIIVVCCLLLFLALFTWNQRTGTLDQGAGATGMEISGVLLKSVTGVRDGAMRVWDKYIALMGVWEENEELKKELLRKEKELLQAKEGLVELEAYRAFFRVEVPPDWKPHAARVLAWKIGPLGVLETVLLGKGFLSGAQPGVPVVTDKGLVGRVFRSAPTTSQCLLLVDGGSRVAVITSEGRVHGILSGAGYGKPLELRFVSQNVKVNPGEVLYTSGLDSAYPQGVPVATVTHVALSSSSSMQEIFAEPFVDVANLETVFLLEKPEGLYLPEASQVYTPQDEAPVSPLPEMPEGVTDRAFGNAAPGEQ